MSSEEACKKTHPKFTITCDACGSKSVFVESDIGGSEESGSWGGVCLTCADCHESDEIYSA
jgi:hypothetical protein